ncbi:MAG: prepilin-type N-terminal cleavage/methylation domain-containing protein [Candidatus Acidiferrales bacterium]
MNNQAARTRQTFHSSAGFTLIEAAIALVVLAIGIMGLAAMMTNGIAYMSMSQADYLAQQKAAEAVESIFYARDSQLYTWAQIQNVSNGGIFLNPAEVLCDPGPDGIIDTADDNTADLDAVYIPGPSGTLDGAGAIKQTLDTYTRTIAITAVPGETDVRQITVTINYTAGRFKRQYVLTSYICEFS